jgi:signal transduction histidine kinase
MKLPTPGARTLLLLLALLAIVLPVALVWSSYRTFDSQQTQRRVHLRSRIAAVAARLETLPDPSSPEALELLFDDEPGLVDLRVFSVPAPNDGLDELWQGRELFRLEDTLFNGDPILRGFLPFHSSSGLRLARVDLSYRAADFLILPARRSLYVSALAGLAFLLLSLLTAWAFARSRRAELRQAELEHLAQLGQMSAVLAHEIRNPLGTIKGFSQLLSEQIPTPLSPLLEPILTQTTRLEQLVKDLLLYGRPPQPAPSSVALDEIVESLRSHAAHLAAPRVQFDFFSDPGTVVTDRDLLDQALLNLLRNAAEAVQGATDPRVSLQFRRSSTRLAISVSDNGPGFSQEALDHLYQPFFTTRAFGTGLGLSTTRNLIRSLGGTLALSNPPSGGARADVVLPLEST